MNTLFTFEAEPYSDGSQTRQSRSSPPLKDYSGDLEQTTPPARPVNRRVAEMAECNERATNATHCAGPHRCPPIPVLLCGYGVDGIPFEYVAGRTSDGQSQIQRSSNGLFQVVGSSPKRERFRPEVRDALRRFLSLMTRFGMPIQTILTMGSYNCRCIKGGARVSNNLSNHAYGDAIDITGVRWATTGRPAGRLPETIIHNWGKDAVEQGILRRINACLRLCFNTVIDQSFNAAHRNHFHCDTNVSNGGRRRHDTTTWVYVQDVLKNVLGFSSVRHDGHFNDSTRNALSSFSGIPATRLSSGRDLDVALDRLFTHVASGGGTSSITQGTEGLSRDLLEFDEAAGDPWSGEVTTPSQNQVPGNPAGPSGPFGVLTVSGRPSFRYAFTAEDALWLARFVIGEAGGRNDPGSHAVIWAMFNRYAFFTHKVYPTFSRFIRAYSTPLQASLNSGGAAARHYQNADFVRTGGNYTGQYAHVPRGQLGRFLRLQATPWSSLPAAARGLAESALRGQVPNPIGNASEFANTAVYYKQRHGQWPTPDQWRAYNAALGQQKGWTWIGDVPSLTQYRKNTFYVDNRVAQLSQGAVVVSGAQQSAPAPAQASVPSALLSALRQGERDENKLTNIVFFARHPERDGQSIKRSEPDFPALSREWISIRDGLVRPALRGGAPAPTEPLAPRQPAGGVCSAAWPTAKIAALRAGGVATALAEWTRWNHGNLKESEAAAFPRLVEFWEVGLGKSNARARELARDHNTYHWSAAFISWVMRKAGAGGDFAYAADHGTYIAAAHQNRKTNSCSPFKAYRPNAIAPQPGDLVCTTWKSVPTDLERVRPGTSGYHCDIVVKVEPGKLTTLGGNVSDSVGHKIVKLDANGFLANPKYFAVIKVG